MSGDIDAVRVLADIRTLIDKIRDRAAGRVVVQDVSDGRAEIYTDQAAFVASLRAGKVMQAMQMIVDGAFKAGKVAGAKELASRGRKSTHQESTMLLIGWGVSHSIRRARMAEILSTSFKDLDAFLKYISANKLPGIEGMRRFKESENWHHRQVARDQVRAYLAAWPHRSKAGRPRAKKQK